MDRPLIIYGQFHAIVGSLLGPPRLIVRPAMRAGQRIGLHHFAANRAGEPVVLGAGHVASLSGIVGSNDPDYYLRIRAHSSVG